LVDGTPNGIALAELMNWTGKVFVVPRTALAQVKGRPELQRAGAYLLVGDDPEVLGRLRVYVGEAENLIARVPQHDRDEDKAFYDRAVFITGKDDFLNKSHARWLERRLIALAKANGSVSLANGTAGSLSVAISESDESDMEAFMDHVRLVLPALGFPFIEPKASAALLAARTGAGTPAPLAGGTVAGGGTREGATGPTSPVFGIAVAGAEGRAQEVAGQFFLLAGSVCRRQGMPSWTSYRALRERLVADGRIVDGPNPDLLVVAEDLPLGSPSAGAAIVAGRNMNGRQTWKTPDGRTYQDWVDAQAAATAVSPFIPGSVLEGESVVIGEGPPV
jgi:hypothetical protein